MHVAALIAALVTPGTIAGPGGNGNGNGNGGGETDQLVLTGVVRDFTPGHPDFDVVPPNGYGQCMWNVATTLGADDRPVYVGGGFKVAAQAEDAAGRTISWTLYDADLGDLPAIEGDPDTGSITSAATFDEWYRDLVGVNMSTMATVSGPMLTEGEYAGMYEINIPQFYPIDDMLLGNDSSHNNFFTYEIMAEFVYDAAAGYEFYLKSDDDAQVFIDHKLVADLGGINGSPEQWIDLDRLGLEDGRTYTMHLFKADRSDSSSRFHLVTNVPLESQLSTTFLAMFD